MVSPYARYLPAARRDAARLEPERTWWTWRGHTVHLARARRASGPARVLVVHGAGAHAEALWPFAALLADRGLDVAAVDLPLYGRTRSPDRAAVRYADWVEMLVDLVADEDDGRPLVLLGASIGGLLAHEVAARTSLVDAVAATCLLDPADWRARARMTRFGPLGVVGRPLALLVRGRLARLQVPVSAVADLRRMSRDPGLSSRCAADPAGGGARVPLGFLAGYVRFRHTPVRAVSTPLLLVHPERDAWTPVRLSLRTLVGRRTPADVVLLRGCGHFPVEEPGLSDLVEAVTRLAERQGRERPSGPSS